jgi:pimeloyl-ACP methyl ester carboxylesterase
MEDTMPLLMIVRLLLSIVSWLIVAAAAWLLWSWNQGEYIRGVDGVLRHVRHDWRLWVGLALGVWSIGGGNLLIRPFLARGDRDPLRPGRGDGRLIDGADGARLYVETLGPRDAPCLVLTHGWGLDSTIWAYAKRRLGQDFHLVLWDLPGMGKSRPGKGGITLDAFAENLRQVIAHSGRDRVVLVGHSIGGMTIQTLARDHANLFNRTVAGTVLVNTTYTDPLKTMALSGLMQALRPLIVASAHLTVWLAPLAWIGAWQSYLNGSAHIANRLGFAGRVTHSQLDYTALLTTRNSQAAQARGNLAMFHWDATGALVRIETPVLVLAGDSDIITRAEASRTLVSQAKHAVLDVVSDANHMGFAERHEVYNDAIAAFARRVSAPPEVETPFPPYRSAG